MAVRKNREDIIKVLMRHPDIDPNRGWKKSPLFYACKMKRRRLAMHLLLHYRINPNLGCSISKTSPIFISASKNDSQTVRMLIEMPTLNPNLGNLQYTPLGIACKSQFPEIVRLLIRHPKTDVNAGFQSGVRKTGLHLACENGNVEIVKLLLCVKDVDTKLLDGTGFYAKDYAKDFDVRTFLEEFEDDKESFREKYKEKESEDEILEEDDAVVTKKKKEKRVGEKKEKKKKTEVKKEKKKKASKSSELFEFLKSCALEKYLKRFLQEKIEFDDLPFVEVDDVEMIFKEKKVHMKRFFRHVENTL